MKTLERNTSSSDVLPKITIDNSLPDLSNHPVVVRKVEKAREMLKKHPVPEHLLRNK